MNFLPHSTEKERKELILIEKTKQELGNDPIELGRHSNKKVFFKCVVCKKAHLLSHKQLLDGKGLSHPGECRTIFKREGGKRARRNEDSKHKERRKQRLREVQKERGSEIVKKRKQTMLKRYGTEHVLQNKEIRQRCKEKIQKNFEERGDEIIKKRKNTNLKKYCSTNYLTSKEGQQKIKQFNQKRLGVDYPFQNAEYQTKCRAVINKKYGVSNIRKLDEFKNKLKEWCQRNPEGRFTSKAEQEILDWIKIYYCNAAKKWIGKHELDILIPEINLGIEYNGLYWHSEAIKGKNYHKDKTKYFEEKKIRVIHIWQHEWEERKEQVKSFLLSAIHKNKLFLNPRDCDIKWSSEKEDIIVVHDFLEKYHIQGAVSTTKFAILTKHKEKLVAVATFAKHHRGKDIWTLSRFCSKTNYTIRGLLGKISTMAFEYLKQPLISWADYRLSNGKGYEKAGWQLEERLRPDYFYCNTSNGKVISKQSRQKKLVGTPDDMTEREHAISDGLMRIWDCGKLRYVFNPSQEPIQTL